ncbi:S-adenosyl-L-methionine-dependent methyltransferase [Calycina marina]|uniref:DNA (cytosine-5-)-methyltransferase n=1 Tax=Calycina marina TaxID=1763456 RepID=A0A9P8CDY3_9HELO|nr:S-adenosyl-L-methionine-dependent methyltransferase [Calycina marina]
MPGMFIELIDGEFLQIKSIAGNSDSNEAILRGYRLQRCSSMNGMLEKKLNELCFFHEVDLDDPRPLLEQSVCEFSIAQVKKIRNVRLTNQKFPLDRNFNNSDFGSQLDAAQNGGLTARWKYICTYKSAAQRYGNEFHDRAFEHVRADEVQGPVTSSDAALRETWRGETIIGGSYLPFTHSQEHVPPTRAPGQMFTYGDAFCGTGGTTRGALLANLKIKWGFDFNAQACVSWKSNFPDADNYELHSSEFVQTARKLIEAGAQAKFKVDILHLSPPCQFFSVAHSVMGKNDEHNSASLFAVRDVIEVATPRVVTLEQAFGIVRPQFMWYLAALIQMFTSLGFSLRWALVHFEDWGLPQRRKRLIMIASCPGEPLPRLPAPTHSATGMHGLKLYATVNATLAQIPHGAPKHNPSELHAQDYKPWDGDAILPRSMTCAGGQNWHPSGRRDFTECEYAALQGFPPGHIFKGSYVRKQIGNAVPPSVARVLFESVKRDLCVADGIVDEPEIMVVD